MVLCLALLQSDSSQAIAELRNGDIRCVMVTGDNAQCGHYVAEKCGMISPQAQMLLGELDESNQVVWSGMAVEDQENKTRMSTAQLYGKNTLNKLQVWDRSACMVCRELPPPVFPALRSSQGDLL